MAFVSVADLLGPAEAGGYAVGAFNANNMEITQAIVRAAEAENSPVIIQASQGAITYAGLDYIVAMVRVAADKSKVPIALHLDHGTDMEQVERCIFHGFSSVMYDGSKGSLEDNITLTRRVIELARPRGISVEAELGKIGGVEDNVSVDEKEAMYTDPDEAERFVAATGVDSLAIAIGTAHGQYKGEPKLDFERLDKIRRLTGVPIVLHGSSGVPDDAILKAVSLGVRKINIDTNIREAFVWAMQAAMEKNPKEIDPRKLLGPARDAATEVIREKIRLFGSSGRA
ncbi:MAG: class II fructose-1,6-bisphosphate aldolase [Firmicutes bacterium]|nr:class II fructose-1,6-bisphosphate aldolase [Bacillota bacterium]